MGQSMLPVSGGGAKVAVGKFKDTSKIYIFLHDSLPGTNSEKDIYKTGNLQKIPSAVIGCKKILVIIQNVMNIEEYLVGFIGETFTWEHPSVGTVTTTFSISSKGYLHMKNTSSSNYSLGTSGSSGTSIICLVGID